MNPSSTSSSLAVALLDSVSLNSICHMLLLIHIHRCFSAQSFVPRLPKPMATCIIYTVFNIIQLLHLFFGAFSHEILLDIYHLASPTVLSLGHGVVYGWASLLPTLVHLALCIMIPILISYCLTCRRQSEFGGISIWITYALGRHRQHFMLGVYQEYVRPTYVPPILDPALHWSDVILFDMTDTTDIHEWPKLFKSHKLLNSCHQDQPSHFTRRQR